MIRNRNRIFSVILGVFVLMNIACQKIESYPPEPKIAFKEVIVVDSTDVLDNPIKHVTLVFSVIDGDGDIGLEEKDTVGPFHRDSAYYYNLFIKEYEKIGDQYIENTSSEFPRNFRIPNLTPEGQNKTLIADVYVEMEYRYSKKNPLPFKEFKYYYYLVDRALNESNLDTTSLILF